MNEITVRGALERLALLKGTTVTVIGRLSLEFEGCCINQIPQRDTPSESSIKSSSIWVDFDLNAIGHDLQWLRQFDSRHVRLTGTLEAPLDGYGCGHMGLWPAEMLVNSIEKRKMK